MPVDTDDASVIESDQPVVVQHTRLDSRQPALALLSTIAVGRHERARFSLRAAPRPRGRPASGVPVGAPAIARGDVTAPRQLLH